MFRLVTAEMLSPAALRGGPPGRASLSVSPAALLLLQILAVLPPHRANHARRGPGSQSSRLAGGADPGRGPQRGCRVGDPGAPRSSWCDARLSPRAVKIG